MSFIKPLSILTSTILLLTTISMPGKPSVVSKGTATICINNNTDFQVRVLEEDLLLNTVIATIKPNQTFDYKPEIKIFKEKPLSTSLAIAPDNGSNMVYILRKRLNASDATPTIDIKELIKTDKQAGFTVLYGTKDECFRNKIASYGILFGLCSAVMITSILNGSK